MKMWRCQFGSVRGVEGDVEINVYFENDFVYNDLVDVMGCDLDG